MSAHVLLNLLNKLGKRGKMRGWLSILSLFATDFINSIIQESTNVRFYLSYGIKITFCLKNVIMLPLSTHRYYGRHNVSRKSVNH